MKVLVTGGLGFIGSHICVELLKANHDVVVIDNLNNSELSTKDKIETISSKKIKFYQISLLNLKDTEEVFKKENIESIIHCAGHKAVGESVRQPLYYYQENLNMTFNLLKLIKEYPILSFVFSSSATVYGAIDKVLSETDTVGMKITNPYGMTKYMQEIILQDYVKSFNFLNKKPFQLVILRYFNPVGAHSSGLIGENPRDVPNNLMPYVMRVASNNNNLEFKDESRYNHLTIFGNDYNTNDGTCIRDFIHVVDLATSHVIAIEHNLDSKYIENTHIFNIGTGNGTSVLELVEAFKKVNSVNLKYIYGDRREGDICKVVCDPTKANTILGWKAKYDISDMVRDSWAFMNK